MDAEISDLKEKLAQAQLSADTAITQSQLLLAAQSSQGATNELNQINEKVRDAADETLTETQKLDSPTEKEKAPPAEGGPTREELLKEVQELRKRNAELEAEVKSLREAPKLAELAGSGTKLSHANKSRPGVRSRPQRSAVSEPTTTSQDSAPEPTISPTTFPEKPPRSPTKGETTTPTKETVASPVKTSPTTPTPTPEEEIRRKVAGMGGGFNPLAGMGGMAPSNLLLKKNALSRSGSVENSLDSKSAGDDVNEEEVRAWVAETVRDEAVREGGLKDALRSGVVLCRLVNKLRPDKEVKINMGKFPFMHMENINNYLKVADAVGVPKQFAFQAPDLYDGTNLKKVLQHLAALRKAVESK
ncbi:hypothetical protein HK097_011290 [Rhizophlyctis rosea]|uniref:Calponin-homology (CH) domain-containing protein n=1 Tax=Rhizophlyctis rosea TaxID=64517 RepID=A0AAD5S9C7_9FUNG|nr:hypothetical protein HK097_011290 [Rhizophlyctis rosea]